MRAGYPLPDSHAANSSRSRRAVPARGVVGRLGRDRLPRPMGRREARQHRNRLALPSGRPVRVPQLRGGPSPRRPGGPLAARPGRPSERQGRCAAPELVALPGSVPGVRPHRRDHHPHHADHAPPAGAPHPGAHRRQGRRRAVDVPGLRSRGDDGAAVRRSAVSPKSGRRRERRADRHALLRQGHRSRKRRRLRRTWAGCGQTRSGR